jgi:molecular chaperone HscB
MNIQQDFFQCYKLKRVYSIDLDELSNRHYQLQKQFHPDTHLNSLVSEQLLATKITAYLNVAFKTLRNSFSRGVYLLKLAGLDPLSSSNTDMPVEFLIQQMARRESLENLHESTDARAILDEMLTSLNGEITKMEQDFSCAYSLGHLKTAEFLIRKIYFLIKLKKKTKIKRNNTIRKTTNNT